jgi:integrase
MDSRSLRGCRAGPVRRYASPHAAAVLAPLIELRPHPTDYVFKNVHGGPIKPDNFYDIFRDAQRALEMPLRDLHATKDTYVSLALTSGVNLRWLSEQAGVHESTLLRHYGSFPETTGSSGVFQAALNRRREELWSRVTDRLRALLPLGDRHP